MCKYTKSINLSTAEEWSLPPCSRCLTGKVPSPCLRGAGRLFLKPTDLHEDMLHLCTSQTVGSIKEGTPYRCEEHTSIILKSRVQMLHSFLNAVFHIHIHPWIYCNLYIMQYFPRQHSEGRAPRDPHPTAMALLSPSLFHPRHCQKENARRGNSRVWKRRWLKPGSAGAVLGTIVGCDTAGDARLKYFLGWLNGLIQ